MSDKEKGLGDGFLPSPEEIDRVANKVVKALSDLRDELGRNHEEFMRNIEIQKLLGTFLMEKPDGLERRKKIMDKMPDSELERAMSALQKLGAEMSAYRAYQRGK